MTLDKTMTNPYVAALQWHIDHELDVVLDDAPVDRTLAPSAPGCAQAQTQNAPIAPQSTRNAGFAAQVQSAIDAAKACTNLDELRTAIAAFDGLEIKRTATNMVFADGNARAHVMIVGEAPETEEDRQGQAFVGASGQLLDRMFGCIGLGRGQAEPEKALYLSNILNWRPPGNRTPTQAEIALALPFIERHIALVRPRFLVLLGAVAGKTLLGMDQPISRMRGKMHVYKPQTSGIDADLEGAAQPTQALPTYHPSFLLNTPLQKRKSWQDLLLLQDKISL